MSSPSFEAGPSVPIATLIPLSNNFLTGQIPDANFELEPGHVTTLILLFKIIS